MYMHWGVGLGWGLALSKAYFRLGGASVLCSYVLRHCTTRLQIIWERQERCPLSFVETVPLTVQSSATERMTEQE